ncbi:MAG: lipopolysaccharide heptosyltransferase I [Burkholderiales bacterium]|nr:lipopolysaccharide heptosyltransferase I [Burkholderiales bacterium]
MSGPAVLVVRPSSLGDIVHALSLVSDVEAQLPGAAIDWVAEEAFVPLVALDPRIRRVVPLALRRWRRWPPGSQALRELRSFTADLRAQRYDAILNLQEQFKGALVARLARGRRHGLDWRSIREPIATLVDDVHHAIPRDQHFIDKARALAGAALGYPVRGAPRWKLTPPAPGPLAPTGPYALALHATSRADKLWPEEAWRGLVAQLAQAGFTVLLPWGDDAERARSERLARAASAAVVPPRRSLPEMAALARHAGVVVGVDTGLTHLAAALGTPTVAIFTATDATLAGVARTGTHAEDQGGRGRVPTQDEVLAAIGRVRHRALRC